MSSSPRIALLLRRIGPYHHARFNHVDHELDLNVIETRPGSQEYPWKMEDGSQKSKAGSLGSVFNYKLYSLERAHDPESGWRGRELKIRIKTILNKIDPDVIVTTGWADREYHAAVLWAQKRNIPCVVISDSTEQDVNRYQLIEWVKRKILKNYSTALVAGKRSSDYIQKLGMQPNRIFTAWDVVDNHYFNYESKKTKNDFFLHEKYPLPESFYLCVSRFIPKKNILGLIHAFKKFSLRGNHNHIHLVLLGSGELETEIKNQIKKNGLEDFIHLFGFVQYPELPFFYANALALILPSFFDQWGLVVNEALACGKPVIVSKNCGCVDELVDHGRNGYIIDPYDQTGLTNAMVCMAEKQLLPDRHKVIDNFDLSAFSNGLTCAASLALDKANSHYPLIPGLISKLLASR